MSEITNLISAFADWSSFILLITGLVVGVITSIASSRLLRSRRSAELRLAEKLYEYYYLRAQLEHLKRVSLELEKLLQLQSVDEVRGENRVVDDYARLVEQLTLQMEDEQERLIIHALKQPSEHGRNRYLRRLAKEASSATLRMVSP